MSGTRTAEFPSRETTQASESGVASMRARTASAPILKYGLEKYVSFRTFMTPDYLYMSMLWPQSAKPIFHIKYSLNNSTAVGIHEKRLEEAGVKRGTSVLQFNSANHCTATALKCKA